MTGEQGKKCEDCKESLGKATPSADNSNKIRNMSSNPSKDSAGLGPSSSWKLPDGIEDHLEDGIIKAVIGVGVGGALGMLLFRSGKGWRSASVATGLGVAVGSTYARVMNGSQVRFESPSVAQVQTFKTEAPPLREETAPAKET